MGVDSSVDDFLDYLMEEEEGGYVDVPGDSGGCTKYGIVRRTLSRWRRKEVSCEDVKALTKGEARHIYTQWYYRDPKFDQIPATPRKLRNLLVDAAVQHGTGKADANQSCPATHWLQEAVGAHSDGIIGPHTLAAVQSADLEAAYRGVLSRRLEYYGGILSNHPDQAKFARGWMRRMRPFVEAV